MVHEFSLMVVLAVSITSVPLAGQSSSQPPKRDGMAETVLSGCLRESRADTTTADPKGMIYTLDVADTSGATTAAPGSSARPATVAKTRYALSADASVDFAKHVGHHVQLTGRVQAVKGAGPSGNQSASAPAGAKPLPGAAQQMLQVTALKMIAATCP